MLRTNFMLSYVPVRGLKRDRVQYRAETRRATRDLAPPPAPVELMEPI